MWINEHLVISSTEAKDFLLIFGLMAHKMAEDHCNVCVFKTMMATAART